MDYEDLDIEDLFLKRISNTSINMVRNITNEEIKTAMFNIGDDRAPGPDGFTFAFFKKSWETVGLVPSIPKSMVYFCNVHNQIKAEIKGELSVKYLGVPLISSRLLNRDCKILVEKVANRAIILVIPIGIIHDIEQLMRVNRKSTWTWFDCWNVQSPLIQYLMPRDITHDGYNLQTCVVDMVSNEGWLWPQAWLLKAPRLDLIPVLTLVESWMDKPQWRAANGAMAHRRNAKSVIGRLLVADTSYCIWLECNNRTFKNIRCTPKEIQDSIIITVCLKLLSCQFKNTAMVNELLARWKMPKNFRLYS
ncbi:hypothetical protein Tco_1218353 [Tanacetum coccineum]